MCPLVADGAAGWERDVSRHLFDRGAHRSPRKPTWTSLYCREARESQADAGLAGLSAQAQRCKAEVMLELGAHEPSGLQGQLCLFTSKSDYKEIEYEGLREPSPGAKEHVLFAH